MLFVARKILGFCSMNFILRTIASGYRKQGKRFIKHKPKSEKNIAERSRTTLCFIKMFSVKKIQNKQRQKTVTSERKMWVELNLIPRVSLFPSLRDPGNEVDLNFKQNEEGGEGNCFISFYWLRHK